MAFLGIVYTILIFSVIIFIHELGHFIVARLCGVRVIEFSLGMGPVLLKKQGKETLYCLRAFPIGGYAAMEGENADMGGTNTDGKDNKNGGGSAEITAEATEIINTEEAPIPFDNSKSFSNKNVPKRIAICLAGATMNLLLGFAIIALSLIGTKQFATTTVHSFRENAVSSSYGLQQADKIVKINKTTMFTDRDIVFEMLRDGDGVYDMTVIRDGKRVLLPAVNFSLTEEPDGKKSVYFDFIVESQKAGFFSGIVRAFNETVSLARNSWSSIGDLVTGKVSVTELSGPVGVGQVVTQAAGMGLASVISLAAFISISIGMFNLLPFPALDGGRVVIYLIEAVRRKPIIPKIETWINAAGLMFLLLVMVLITMKDIWGLFT